MNNLLIFLFCDRHMKRFFLVLAVALPLFFTIQSFNEQPSSDAIAADTLCFSRDILPIFNSNCAMTGCHDVSSHQSGYRMTTYSGVKAGIVANNANSSSFYRQIINKTMPPFPYLAVPDSFRTRILTWINQGAKNTTCTDATCDTSNVTYAKDIKPIIQLNCVGCHQSSLAGGGIFLDVDADNEAQKVTIYAAAEHMSSSNMPKNITEKISSCQISSVLNVFCKI